jgi:hypothetical protein
MIEVVLFFERYEAVLYFVLGLGAIVYAWRFYNAWALMRSAVFGLEQISAQRQLSRATVALIAILFIGVFVFTVVTVVGPQVDPPDAFFPPQDATAAVASGTLPVGAATATDFPAVAINAEGCIEGEIEITAPVSGETLQGETAVIGTVDVENFGFYKIEVSRAEETLWLTVQAGRALVQNAELLQSWDTSILPPGEYVLQLLVTDNDGDPFPACRIPIRIATP